MEAAQRRHLLIKTYESSLPGCLLQAPSPTLSHLLFLIFSLSLPRLCLSPSLSSGLLSRLLFSTFSDSVSFTGSVVDLEAVNPLIHNQYRPSLSFFFLFFFPQLRTDEKLTHPIVTFSFCACR